MPVFSVIINNYNYARYLRGCIESVRNQSFRDFELILVDDGSTDESLAIACDFDDIRVLTTDRIGQARACLAAVRQARGTYIYFLDADDEAKPDLLEIVAHKIQRNPSKIQFQLEPIDERGRAVGESFPFYPQDYDSFEMIEEVMNSGFYLTPQTSGNVFAKRIFDHIHDIDYETAINGVTLLLAPFIGNVVTISRPLARYRLHGENESQRLRSDRFRKERDRFVHRLGHAERILSSLEGQVVLKRPPEEMLFFVDRLIMEKACQRLKLGLHEVHSFLTAVYREAGWPRSLKLTIWSMLMCFGPERLRRILF